MRRNKSRFRKFLASPVTLLLVVIMLVWLSRAAWNIRTKTVLSDNKLEEAKSALAKVESNKEKVTRQLGNLSSDEGIAAEIREKYHAVEPGEQVAVVINTEAQRQASATAAASDSEPDEKEGFWRRFLRAIGF